MYSLLYSRDKIHNLRNVCEFYAAYSNRPVRTEIKVSSLAAAV